MEAAQAAIVPGEGKAVTSFRLQMKPLLAACPEALNLLFRKRRQGSRRTNRPAASDAVLRAVHAGGGHSWESATAVEGTISANRA
jgi:hypothetical protein